MKVKGISQLRLNQDRMETRSVQLTGAGGLAHSAANSWRSAQSGERCVLVRISVDESGTVTGRANGPGAGRFDQIGLRLGTWSGQASRVEDRKLRQTSREKREANRRLDDLIRGDSWLFLVEFVCGIKRMDTRQKDNEKEIEKEKETAPGDRNPKVRGVAKSNRTRPRMMAVEGSIYLKASA
ncbi:hypothetical protein F2Q68_00021095 [Brassica cretica]|uniref:Uncharacterized protein n=1 Tax=Brassica cretica TaxID=69181 RepID=A0A8S9G491_BRACR|nr:hypothetical protein F2Q68_00021095 [Brassica cretica]